MTKISSSNFVKRGWGYSIVILAFISSFFVINYFNFQPSLVQPAAVFIHETFPHNCRMWGAYSSNIIPFNIIEKNLVTDANSLYALSPANDDGWGIAGYNASGTLNILDRGYLPANQDPDFTDKVSDLQNTKPKVAMAHIRLSSSGCRGDLVADPHPFSRFKNNKTWTFEHNGTIDKAVLQRLIGTRYLEANPPDCSKIVACQPCIGSNWIDTELYFLLMLKNIEEKNWDAQAGVIETIKQLIQADPSDNKNFILSDGSKMWAYRRGNSSHSLYYLNNAQEKYTLVASQYPDISQGNWLKVEDGQLIEMRQDKAPLTMIVTATSSPTIIESVSNPDKKTVMLQQLKKFSENTKNLFYGYYGKQVTLLQQKLKAIGLTTKTFQPTGYFGSITQKAVKEFQKIMNLKITGKVDDQTRKILNAK
jgi:predicted glutamine amidotransferase